MADLRLEETRRIWDGEAADFDKEPDHGLRDPVVRAAWARRFREWLPDTPVIVLDLGCGTGSLSVLIASLGHVVTGVDVSPAMLALARAKAADFGLSVDFQMGDAADPAFAPQQFDVLVCRHLLWALPEPAHVLRRWAELLKPGGRMLLIEGFWFTGAGLHSSEILDDLPSDMVNVVVENLSDQSELWGRAVSDERYFVRATRSALV